MIPETHNPTNPPKKETSRMSTPIVSAWMPSASLTKPPSVNMALAAQTSAPSFPQITPSSYNYAVSETNGVTGQLTSISPFNCAMPGPAQALCDYSNYAHPELVFTLVQVWPLFNQDDAMQAANPNKQSQKVPAYQITRKADGLLLDTVLAGNLFIYCGAGPSYFDHLIEMWYGAGGTQEKALGVAA